MNKYSLLLILLFTQSILFGQAPGLLKAAGKIPKDFTTASAEKYKKKIEELEHNKSKTSRRTKVNKKQFYLESSFTIDDILQSGAILFNDPISTYVTQVMENLPLSPALKKVKPRVYLLNSNEVNAFATEQGIIFISVGLLANIENEAQLAFILGHELSHIEHKHSIDKFLQNKELSTRDYEKNLKSISIDKKLFKEALYSRKLEEEADEEGLALFLQSKYDPKAINGIFEVLHYSYLPYEDIPLSNSFFEDENYLFPKAYALEKVNAIQPMEVDAEEEKKSSHPASAKRKSKLNASIQAESSDGRSTYIVGEAAFIKAQDIARYQLPFLALESGNFGRAIYNAFLQLQEHPNDLELKKVIGKGLYMESKIRNQKEMTKNGIKRYYKYVEEMEGEAQALDHLISKLSDQELNVLALKYNFELAQVNENDEELQTIVSDLFLEINKHQKNFEAYSGIPPTKKPETPTAPESEAAKDEVDEEKGASRKSKIAKANEQGNQEEPEKEIIAEDNYWQFAFVNHIKSAAFKDEADAGKKLFNERAADAEDDDVAQNYREQRTKERKKGKSLGINKVIVVNPFYLALDERKKSAVQYIRSEKKQAGLRKKIHSVAKISSLDVDIMDFTALGVNEIEKFNDIIEIEKYVSNQFNFDELSLTPSFNQTQVNAIAKKYNTNYFLWTGVISLREKENAAGKLAVSVLFPFALPIILPDVLTPDYDMLYYAILFDVTTGRRSIIKMDYFNEKDSDTLMKAHIYDVFHQINKRNK